MRKYELFLGSDQLEFSSQLGLTQPSSFVPIIDASSGHIAYTYTYMCRFVSGAPLISQPSGVALKWMISLAGWGKSSTILISACKSTSLGHFLIGLEVHKSCHEWSWMHCNNFAISTGGHSWIPPYLERNFEWDKRKEFLSEIKSFLLLTIDRA